MASLEIMIKLSIRLAVSIALYFYKQNFTAE